MFGGSVYADQLVFGIRAVECEVEIQTAVEELPLSTYFDGVADFRFQIFCKVVVDGFHYAACRAGLRRAGDADGKVVADLCPGSTNLAEAYPFGQVESFVENP